MIIKIMNSHSRRVYWSIAILVVIIAAVIFTYNNEMFYKSTIAKVVSMSESKTVEREGLCGEKETYMKQKLTLKIMNGSHKGETYTKNNSYGESLVKGERYTAGNEIFVSLTENGDTYRVNINSYKRDYYAVGLVGIMFWGLFVAAGWAGVRTILSMVGNVILFCLSIWLFEHNVHIAMLTVMMIVGYSLLTLFLIGGLSRKMVLSAVSTLITLLLVFIIYIIVAKCTTDMPYYMLDLYVFSADLLEAVFMSSVLVGSLGAIMDVAVTVNSAVSEIIATSNRASVKDLIKSVRYIGNDIMGTMTSVLMFNYVSGTLPLMILKLRTQYYFTHLLRYDFSFEIVRFLIGSIAIVMAIPVSGVIAIGYHYIQMKRAGEVEE